MSKPRIIAGLELGSSTISTLISQVGNEGSEADSINVVGVASVPSRGIKKGQIVDIEEAVEATIASVEAAERMAGYNLNSAFVAIGGASITSQNSHGVVAVTEPDKEITPVDTQRVIEAASAVSVPSSREIVHIIPKEYIVDGESGVKDPVGMGGIRLEVETHLITCGVSTLRNIKKAVNEVGINIEEFVFTGIAAGNAVLTRTEKELGCVLIDIGGGTTSIIVYMDGSLAYSSVIPVGAKNVTNDLAIGLRVSLEIAEKIKVNLNKHSKNVSGTDDKSKQLIDLTSYGITGEKMVPKKTLIEGIVKPRLNEIFTMVKIQLEKEGLKNKIPSGVIITGGGAETIGAEESVKRILSLPVRIGKPRGVSGLVDDIITPTFAVPIGLILYGAETSSNKNLTSFTKKLKLPTGGVFNKLVTSIKDLLP